MLVLSRKKNESVVIDGEVSVTVLSVDGGKVRLGIKAPRYITVDRCEIANHRAETAEADRRLAVARGRA